MATKHLTLGFKSPGDTRKPRTVCIVIQDEDFLVEYVIDLSEHDFTALMAGQSIQVDPAVSIR